MFIFVEREDGSNKNFTVINSNIIKNITVNVDLEKSNKSEVEDKFSYKIYFKDYDDNIYKVSSSYIVNNTTLGEIGLEVRILRIIEEVLNSNKSLQKSFENEVTDELLLLLNRRY